MPKVGISISIITAISPLDLATLSSGVPDSFFFGGGGWGTPGMREVASSVSASSPVDGGATSSASTSLATIAGMMVYEMWIQLLHGVQVNKIAEGVGASWRRYGGLNSERRKKCIVL